MNNPRRHFHTRVLTSILLVSSVLCSTAATYHVSITGNDSNPGTVASPWRTVQKAATTSRAGDTVLIGPGDYAEHVQQTAVGTASQPIIFRASPPREASIRAFRIFGAHVQLEGLRLSRYSGVNNLWAAAARIESTANFASVRDCLFSDTPFAIAHDFSFHQDGNRIVSPSSDFLASGFVPGSRIYLGAAGLPGLFYVNHDTTWIVSRVEPTTMWVTNTLASQFQFDPGSNYWAVIRAATFTTGFRAVDIVPTSGLSASNVLISGNTFSNWMGTVVSMTGNGHRLERNTATKLWSFRFVDFTGNNHIIRSNIVKDSPNILHYSVPEGALLEHPAGSGWYDYQVSMFSSSTKNHAANTNILFSHNWFENIENQLGGIADEVDETFGIEFRNNVFVGVSQHFSGGRDGMLWISNTFYRCAFDNVIHPLAIGGRPPSQSGYVVARNLFIDCGPYSGYEGRGFYSVSTNAVNPSVDFNMVASAELTGYGPKQGFTEPNGVNGGNPIFLNPLDPLGPDGIPFTGDDGLQILPNSPAAALGAGALGVYTAPAEHPIAHFQITSPRGWFEPTGTNYNRAWFAALPTARGSVQRPYKTPPLLGTIPLSAQFSASLSRPGVASQSPTPIITEYTWTVDGVSTTRSTPDYTHIFTTPGTKMIHLTVRNSRGNSHSISNVFAVTSGPANQDYLGRPMPPQGVRLRN